MGAAGAQRKIVDGQAIVRAAGIEIDPAQPETGVGSDLKAADGAFQGCSAGGGIAVAGADVGCVGANEVQCCEVDEVSLGQRDGIGAVLKNQAVAAVGFAEAPLLTGEGRRRAE
ncbi:MAG: hypothetical protein CVU33_10320 [Betaproteobacteria bacterium HGW-Betaproteobacteria-6]|nr:MAG: hypothetical protein CVU33_10320 [Betaproteobacteria bacterium HGW-Betaproteobacteria-6]